MFLDSNTMCIFSNLFIIVSPDSHSTRETLWGASIWSSAVICWGKRESFLFKHSRHLVFNSKSNCRDTHCNPSSTQLNHLSIYIILVLHNPYLCKLLMLNVLLCVLVRYINWNIGTPFKKVLSINKKLFFTIENVVSSSNSMPISFQWLPIVFLYLMWSCK